MQSLKFRIEGISPLLMHNGRLANPSDHYAQEMKKITSKRKKTTADYEELARLEWFGGLYLANEEPCIPGQIFEAAMIGKGGAARKQNMGKQAAAALWVFDDFPLEYDGPRDPYELWKLEEFRLQVLAVVTTSRILRTRPMFKDWAANVSLEFNPELLDEDVVCRWAEVAGAQVGLMDWRPKFGRFTVS